jgi:hypothetical protein
LLAKQKHEEGAVNRACLNEASSERKGKRDLRTRLNEANLDGVDTTRDICGNAGWSLPMQHAERGSPGIAGAGVARGRLGHGVVGVDAHPYRVVEIYSMIHLGSSY